MRYNSTEISHFLLIDSHNYLNYTNARETFLDFLRNPGGQRVSLYMTVLHKNLYVL